MSHYYDLTEEEDQNEEEVNLNHGHSYRFRANDYRDEVNISESSDDNEEDNESENDNESGSENSDESENDDEYDKESEPFMNEEEETEESENLDLEIVINGREFFTNKIFMSRSNYIKKLLLNNSKEERINVNIPELEGSTFVYGSDFENIREYFEKGRIHLSSQNIEILTTLAQKLEIETLIKMIDIYNHNIKILFNSHEINLQIEVINHLKEIDDDNFDTTYQKIRDIIETNSLLINEFMFCSIIITLCQIRPFCISILIRFFIKSQEIYSRDLKKIFLHVLFHKSDINGIIAFVLLELWNNKLFSINEIPFKNYLSIHKRLFFALVNSKYANGNDDKNNQSFHKKYSKLGIHPDPLFEILMNDDLKKLQQYSSNIDFNFRGSFDKSIYNKLAIINHMERTKYTNVCSYFGSIKCYEYFVNNNTKIDDEDLTFAILGGSIDIIRKIEMNDRLHMCDITEAHLINSINFHRNEIFEFLFEVYTLNSHQMTLLNLLLANSIQYHNYEIMKYLISKAASFSRIMHISSQSFNFYLTDLSTNFKYQNLFKEFKKKSIRNILRPLIKYQQNDIFRKVIHLSYIICHFHSFIDLYFYAVEKNNIEAVRIFHEIDQFDINFDYQKKTPLLYSMEQNKYHIFLEILNQPGVKIKYKKTYHSKMMHRKLYISEHSKLLQPFDVACQCKNTKFIKALVSVKKVQFPTNLIKEAVSNHNLPVLKFLIDFYHFDFPKESYNPIIDAILKNDIDIVKYLISLPKFSISQDNLNIFFIFYIILKNFRKINNQEIFEILAYNPKFKSKDTFGIDIREKIMIHSCKKGFKDIYFKLVKILGYKIMDHNTAKPSMKKILIKAVQGENSHIILDILANANVDVNYTYKSVFPLFFIIIQSFLLHANVTCGRY